MASQSKGNMSVNQVVDRRCVHRPSKHLLYLHNKKVNNPNKNGQDILTGISPKEIYEWLSSTWNIIIFISSILNHIEKICSTSLVSREMEIKTTMTLYFISTRMAAIEKTDSKLCWQGWGELANHLHCWWEYKITWPTWKTFWQVI